MNAGDDNDAVLGGIGNDTIRGDRGDDTVDGGDGNDLIYGDSTVNGGFATDGNDQLSGGAGDDTFYGGRGNDIEIGGTGNDSLNGNDGADSITGGDGDDAALGGTGNDTILGNAGADWLYGDLGNDLIYGDDTASGVTDGADNISGGDGNDTIYAGGGDDTIRGDWGDDVIFGGDGNDSINGSFGVDTMTGGDGNDTFWGSSGATITDFNTGNTGGINDGIMTNNDFVNLSGYYNAETLAIWNAANPTQQYKTPLGWLRADQADGLLNMTTTAAGLPNFTLTIQTGGVATAAADLTYENTLVMCFAAGTLIETADGPRAVEELKIGDLVETRDNGLQPIRWAGMRHLSAADLEANPKLRPIRIRKGALGSGLPAADLVVSPQHRVLVRSRIAQRMFGADEVLVAARQLCQIDGIDIAGDAEGVSYHHIMFDRHEVVISNGAETESLFTGPEALRAVGPAAREEIFTLFPELATGDYTPEAARLLPSGRLGRKLAVRHLQNGIALVQ